ncbi:MAG TPA: DnaD domain protein [Lactovum miscens]|uniref:DnaD domain protein n=1 Tax=Lactovum miscens TaxID=190387 RepID=UPI002ED9F132
MKPGDRYSILNKGKTSFDESTFAELYLPILGKTAFTLYGLLRSLPDGKFSNLLEYLNIGQARLEGSLDKLSALSLVKIYEQPKYFQILLRSPKSFEDFLSDQLFKQLLISKIGENKVKNFMTLQPEGLDITKKFSEVFDPSLAEGLDESSEKISGDLLDLETFEKMMSDRGLHFINKSTDIIQLFSIAEKFGLDWYALFKLAEETANVDHTINTDAMLQRHVASKQPLPKVDEAFSDLIRVAKAMEPEEFLTQIKRQVGGFVDASELKLLSNFSKQNISSEVQNILIHYALIQQGNASLRPTFVNRIANDWMRKKVVNAELAIERINNFDEESSTSKKVTFSKRENVIPEPVWSNPNYHEVASDDEVAEFKKQLDALQNSN